MNDRVILLPVDGRPELVDWDQTVSEPERVRWLQAKVGGCIQAVPVFPLGMEGADLLLVVNEDAKMQGRPMNLIGSLLHGKPDDLIVGDVVLCWRGAGDIAPLPQGSATPIYELMCALADAR